ncbi:hypothetical protein FQA39_LY16009 [Lamprigera yunnana]|nr:hypothetical protein FQA39_LY16009 [Lamprigera yunnana]
MDLIETDGRVQNRKLSIGEKRMRNKCQEILLIPDEILIKRFEEDPKFVPNDYEYPRPGKDPGLIVIFNQQKFEKFEERLGTNRDVNELILTLGRLGYNIEEEFIYNDLPKKDVLDKLSDLSKRDFSNRNSLIVIFLSHGTKNNVLRTYDEPIFAHEIWGPFSNSNCSWFREKPKLFIFQACKGSLFSKVDERNIEVYPEDLFSMPLEPDMVIAFAAVEGSVSNRHISRGTWFIQELCRNLNAYGRRDDVLSILIRTTKCVVHNYYNIDENSQLIKQIPLFISTLSRKFYLGVGKDRCALAWITENQKEILRRIQTLECTSTNVIQ